MRTLSGFLMMSCFLSTVAVADPIRFDNPDSPDRFEWDSDVPVDFIVLDMMSPYTAQPGTPGTDANISQGWGIDGHEVASYLEAGILPIRNWITSDGSFVLPVAEGTIIGPDYDWSGIPGSVTIYEELDDEVITFIPEGIPQYFGVRWGPDDNVGYGWFGAVRTRQALDVFAWGYETEPGVGVAAGAIPEPASLLGLLLCGAFAARRR